MKAILITIFFLVCSANETMQVLSAQNSVATRINLYIKCNSCDQRFIRQEMNYVNHVRDQSLADVQLFINRIGNGTGSATYELSFTGTNDWNNLNNELSFVSSPTQTRDEIRNSLLQRIEAGLLPYLLQSDLIEEFHFDVKQNDSAGANAAAEEDPWNNWIFELRGEGNISKESSRSGVDTEFGFESDRVTEDWRIRGAMEVNYSENRFSKEEEEIVSTRKYNYAYTRVVASLGSHWSAGSFGGLSHNTYRNQDFSSNLGAALEYSLFPYREVIRREITFAYQLGYRYNRYLERTIYDKDQESLFNHSLSVTVRFRQPWGDIYTKMEASNYLHDFSKNRLEFDNYMSVRIWKGLAVRVSAEVDLIRDQLTLPAGNASLEDLFLRQRQIATDFEMEMGIGLSYTFGSAFNNVVNTRL